MKHKRRQFGLTLTELLVTVAIAAVLMAVAVPAARRITETMRDSAGARALIGAALNNARAIAVREGTYAGVRFQQAADGNTYMVFIVYEYSPTEGIADRFVALDGRKPVLLPEGTRLVDGKMSVVFGSSGRLIIHPVWIKRRGPNDSFFNTLDEVNQKTAMFEQDAGKSDSVNSIRMYTADNDTTVTTLMVSPYTGELIGE